MLFKLKDLSPVNPQTMPGSAWVRLWLNDHTTNDLLVEFQAISMVSIGFQSQQTLRIGDLLICTPPFNTGGGIEGMYRVSACRKSREPKRWLVNADLLALHPTETMLRWYFDNEASHRRSN
jgi:hypothetical protein